MSTLPGFRKVRICFVICAWDRLFEKSSPGRPNLIVPGSVWTLICSLNRLKAVLTESHDSCAVSFRDPASWRFRYTPWNLENPSFKPM